MYTDTIDRSSGRWERQLMVSQWNIILVLEHKESVSDGPHWGFKEDFERDEATWDSVVSLKKAILLVIEKHKRPPIPNYFNILKA